MLFSESLNAALQEASSLNAWLFLSLHNLLSLNKFLWLSWYQETRSWIGKLCGYSHCLQASNSGIRWVTCSSQELYSGKKDHCLWDLTIICGVPDIDSILADSLEAVWSARKAFCQLRITSHRSSSCSLAHPALPRPITKDLLLCVLFFPNRILNEWDLLIRICNNDKKTSSRT